MLAVLMRNLIRSDIYGQNKKWVYYFVNPKKLNLKQIGNRMHAMSYKKSQLKKYTVGT